MQVRLNFLEEVVSAQFHLNPGAIDPAAGTDNLKMCYLATGAKKLLVSTDNMVSYLFIYCCFCMALLDRAFCPSPSVFVCGVIIWEMHLSAHMSMRRFTSLLHQLSPATHFVLVVMTMQSVTSMGHEHA